LISLETGTAPADSHSLGRAIYADPYVARARDKLAGKCHRSLRPHANTRGDSERLVWKPARCGASRLCRLVAWQLVLAIIMLVLVAPSLMEVRAAPPEGVDPNSPEAIWYGGARTPQCWSCCDIADGRPVLAEPDPKSPLGWRVLLADGWHRVPEGVRATRCSEDFVPKPLGNYPEDPEGHAVVWLYKGRIRCFSPPAPRG
jgi:hypothetical protein